MNKQENEIISEENQKDKDINLEIYEIDIRCQEIEVIIENYEFELSEKGNELLTEEEHQNLLAEYKELKKKRRVLLKMNRPKTVWEEIPLWMVIYIIFQIIFSFYYVQALLSVHFAKFLLDLFSSASATLFNIFNFILPTLSVLTSFVIWLLLKNKKQKKFFLIFCFIQIAETLITVGLMFWIILS